MKTLYLESIAGVAGDMFAASFVNAGLVSPDELQMLCKQLDISGVKIHVDKVIRATIQATHIDVLFDRPEWLNRFSSTHHHTLSKTVHGQSPHEHAHVPFRDLEHIVIHSSLPEKTRELACEILNSLAEAEADCHGVSIDEVAFHELGMVDSLMDIVMAAYCITKVKPDFVVSSPIKLGRGLISTAHGVQPVPPPVSARLAVGMPITSIPTAIEKEDIELSTPTGLAILKALNPSFSKEWPEGIVLAKGSGAGTMDLKSYPNLFRISLIETQEKIKALPYDYDSVIEISVNFDDTTPEQLAWTTRKLFEFGALDVWQTSSVGKKGRLLIVLSLLVEQDTWGICVDFLLSKTSTFGLRYKYMERLKLRRHFETRDTKDGSFQVKVGCNTEGKKIKEKFEFDEIQRVWDKDINNLYMKE